MTTTMPATVAEASPPPSLTRVRLRTVPWAGAASVLAALTIWQLASLAGVLPESSLPSAAAVFREWASLLGDGTYWAAAWATLSSAMTALLLVVLIGLPLGLLIGRIHFVRESTWFLVEFLKPIPPIAMLPLALLLWGPGTTMKLTLITYGALWPFLVQIVYGVSQVDTTALRMSRSFRLGAWLTSTRVVVPGLVPFAATGLRVAASIALIVAVVTELVGGVSGLGREIVLAHSASELSRVYALILTTGVLGIAVNFVLARVERPLLFWHPTHREAMTS
jgi:ABC-type nitrate/sulfonate/bicarbonate transport system permease component